VRLPGRAFVPVLEAKGYQPEEVHMGDDKGVGGKPMPDKSGGKDMGGGKPMPDKDMGKGGGKDMGGGKK
jgi:hypothetical protein